jgi:hypothetical protein
MFRIKYKTALNLKDCPTLLSTESEGYISIFILVTGAIACSGDEIENKNDKVHSCFNFT